jgi:hypothetical protein
MEIRRLKVNELSEYINTPEFINSEFIPISKARAISQSFNPDADAEDIALIVASDENHEVVGYIGMLPGYYYEGKATNKLYWNSGWWIHPVKGKKVSMLLFYSMMEICKDKLVLADLTPLTYQILKKTGLFEFSQPKPGVCGYLRLPVKKVLQRQFNIYNKLNVLIIIIDVIANLFVEVYQFFWRLKIILPEDTTINEVRSVDNETSEFINLVTHEKGTFRKQNELNWILQYPWLKESTIKNDPEAKKYYFSTVVQEFEYHCLKIYKNKSLVAFVFLTSRDGSYKVPYVFYNDIEPKILYKIILKYITEKKAISFTTWHPELEKIIKTKFSPFIIKKQIKKQEAYSIQLKNLFKPGFIFQDGEGDMVFT